jgi:hypothetical protein
MSAKKLNKEQLYDKQTIEDENFNKNISTIWQKHG